MADNYRKLTLANEEWRKVVAEAAAAMAQGSRQDGSGSMELEPALSGATAGASSASLSDPPTRAQEKFLRENLLALFASHRESTVKVRALLEELEAVRPGFVSRDQTTNILGACANRACTIVIFCSVHSHRSKGLSPS